MDNRKIIQAGIDYIEDNIKSEISAEELADRAGYSLFYYYKIFTTATGMPVMQFIQRRRLINSIYEIKNGRKRIDVILEYGFDTYSGYYRAFRREFGCTPSYYLKQSRAKRPYRIDLFKEAHMNITHKKVLEILKNWNLDNQKVSDIYCEGTGNKHDNAFFIGNDFVLKFVANPDKIKNIISLSKVIESVGLQVATPIKTLTGEDYAQSGELYFYLTRRLSGNQLSVQKMYDGDYAQKARYVGEIIGQLHLALSKAETIENDTNLYSNVKNWALPKAQEFMKLSNDFCCDFLNMLSKLYDKLPRQIIHRDPNPGNIILADDKWGFIDFELSEMNVRIYDPCYAATAILSESFDNCDKSKWLNIYRNLFYGYDSVVKLTKEELKAIPYILLANQMVCVAWFSQQEKHADLFETNKQMTLWLISIFKELQFE